MICPRCNFEFDPEWHKEWRVASDYEKLESSKVKLTDEEKFFKGLVGELICAAVILEKKGNGHIGSTLGRIVDVAGQLSELNEAEVGIKGNPTGRGYFITRKKR